MRNMVPDIKYKVVDRIDDIDFQEVTDILTFHGLSDLDNDTQKKVFENSFVTIFIEADDKVIGVGRAISDGITHANIYNVAVRDEYRGHGIGKVIVDEILKRVEGCNVTLYTSPKHIGLYEHWGFKRLKTAYVIFADETHYKEAGFID